MWNNALLPPSRNTHLPRPAGPLFAIAVPHDCNPRRRCVSPPS
mgnify:CR=1 FL=1